MSINTGASNNNDAQQNTRRDPRTNAAGGLGGAAPMNNDSQGRTFDFMNTLALPIRGRNSSKHITDFLKNFDEQKRDESVWKVGNVVLDNTHEVGWRFSTIAVTVHALQNPDVIAVYPLVLEHTISRPMESVPVKSGDLEFRLEPVASMAMDQDWEEAVRGLVLDKFPNIKPENITIVAGMTVPKTQDLTDFDVVERLCHNAVLACVTMLVEVLPGFEDVNVSIMDKSITPTVRLETTTFSDQADLLGRKVRQDFRFTFSARNAENERKKTDPFAQNDAAASEVPWGALSAFLEPMYAPQATNSLLAGTNGDLRTRLMAQRAVITDMQQFRMSSTASNLLMLMPVMALADRTVWMSLAYQRMKDFYNKYPEAEFNMTDLGMLNLVTKAFVAGDQVGPAVLVDSNNDPAAFADFMNQSFQENVYVAIDVPHAGPNSWFLSLFSGIANGDQEAMLEFCRGADTLTGGRFTETYFGGNTANMKVSDFFVEVNSTLYLGQYNQRMPDGEVVVTDERTVDYTALQNKLGRTNPNIMQKWSQSWLTKEIPDTAHRLAVRDEVIAGYAGKVEHTDFAERHTFNTELLSTLWNCCLDAGMAPELRYVDAMRGASGGVGAPSFTQYEGLSTSALNTNFSRGGGLGNNRSRGSTLGNNRSGGRWGNR